MTSPSRTLRVGAASAAALLAAACADPTATPAPDAATLSPRFEIGVPVPEQPGTPDQYVVLFKDGATGLADEASAGAGVERGRLAVANGAVYDGVTDPEALAADPNVAGVHENFLSYPSQLSGAPYPTTATFYRRNWQWNMKQIRAEQVPTSVQGQGAKVCIVDSGIDKTHQDLAGKVVAEVSFVDVAHGYAGPGPSPAALDSNGHGTHVASTVTSNGIGVAGVAPRAQLMTAKVFAATGGASLAAIFDGVAWCAANGADAINMSLGGQRTRPLSAARQADSAAYAAVIQSAREAGAVVVVAAGNDALQLNAANAALSYTWPAQIPGALTVGSTSPNPTTFPWPAGTLPGANFDFRPTYSNFGPDVDVYAPGGRGFINAIQSQITAACSGSVVGCESGRQYLSINGTSMASPHVAGIAALVTSRTGAARGLARSEAVERCILQTGDNITVAVGTVSNVRPRINALRAATEPCAGL